MERGGGRGRRWIRPRSLLDVNTKCPIYRAFRVGEGGQGDGALCHERRPFAGEARCIGRDRWIGDKGGGDGAGAGGPTGGGVAGFGDEEIGGVGQGISGRFGPGGGGGGVVFAGEDQGRD